ncbi:hypothetical protein [Paracoccus haeundaensis]|uniref:Uncharacterized protein n=1 Tax=Paracoccus haeundaensis TaxID=225362 RepID=A0A5C4R0S5_9RHOB|nr:hypothetical protein [Paracoccus haeundaensis]TNH37532.1 hypothetical protein FHD67_19855 [Paracoccus haeundaensis]
MQYSANQAAEATGKNVATITRAIKSGKLSATKDTSGAWQIDAAELSRVYPLRKQSLQNLTMQNDANPTQRDKFTEANTLREELAALRERDKLKDTLLENYVAQMADLKEDRDKWRQQATNLLANQEAELVVPAPVKRRRWWPF